uniref:Uncharacterized protein n=1 Tax=uncultured Verrucomicrobiota bacterium TaxID=156588 RepID=D2DXU9_9BACT|nr:hypothetical protein [uncultured Verrucomicrobiota bacterium]
MKRRTLLRTALAPIAGPALLPRRSFAGDASTAVTVAHSEIWRRFIDKHDIMLDFTTLDGAVSLPTPEECRLGKPNALGWWSPIENGAMFNGLYMDAMVSRWRVTKEEAAAAKARRLMSGLLFLNSISDVEGFVGRGVTTDGRSHYPMGSNDQTFPWYFGLWRYLDSGLATEEERERIVKRLTITTAAIVKLKWQMPAEAPFGIRGGFGGYSFESSPRLLFVSKLMHLLTGDASWDKNYRDALTATGGTEEKLSRIEWCERGMTFDARNRHSWTAACGVNALRGLWEMEKDETLRARYAHGLQASADVAMESLPLAEEFDNADTSRFEHDWRVMNAEWRPQQTEQEAQTLAEAQLRNFGKIAPRRGLETRLVREPTFAAWIVTLAPDKAILRTRTDAVQRVIAHYDYAKLIYSQFFPVESAWWRCREAAA